MLIDGTNISIRQSWLDTAMTCPERGRLAMVAPELDGAGDAAAAGTAMHAAIEAYLAGNISVDQMEQYAQAWATKLVEEGEVRNGVVQRIQYKSFDGPPELIYHAGNCTRGWIKDVLPVLVALDQLEGDQEVAFRYRAFEHRGHTIWIQGTTDHVPHRGNRVWDWKSSGSDYKQKAKQMYAVQPTAYAGAAVNGEFGREFSLPLEFAYGVALRLKTKERGQIVVTERTQGHIDFMYRRIRQFVDLYLDVGLEREWPADDDHYLCSEKWCPWYEQCRGANISRNMDLYGYAA